MKLIIIVIFMLVVGGCSSPTTQIHYYQLAPLAIDSYENDTTSPLALAPVRVAGYLNGSGLVIRQSAVEFAIARQHLWADALELQLQRQLSEFFLRALPAQPLVPLNTSDSRTLQLDIDRFYTDEKGIALLSGRYTLVSSQGVITTEAFSYQQPLAADGYAAMVQALSLAWHQLLHDLALKVTR